MRIYFLGVLLVLFCGSNVSGQMKFHRKTIDEGEGGSQDVAVEDMDGDGDLDVIAISSLEGVKLYKNKGTDFSESYLISDRQGLRAVDVGDIDGDGDLDIVVGAGGYTNGFRLAWFENQSKNNVISFIRHVVLDFIPVNEADDSDIYIHSIQLADLDNDSDLDILFGYFHQNKVGWFINDKVNTGVFQGNRIVSTELYDIESVNAGDLNGDGKMDIVATGRGNSNLEQKSQVSWFPGDGKGDFPVQHDFFTKWEECGRDVEIGDIDGDGDLDLVVAFYCVGTVRWFVNDGRGNFETYTIYGGNDRLSYNGGEHRVALGDLDWDGDLDIATTTIGLGNTNLFWYMNEGEKGFDRRLVSSSVQSGYGLKLADMDRDGDIDIVTASSDYNLVSWFQNVSLKASFAGVSNGDRFNRPFSIIVKLNMDVEDLTLDDIVVENGTATELRKKWWNNDKDKDYLIEITPDQDGEVIVKLPEGSFHHVIKVPETNDDMEVRVIYDTTPPFVTSVDVPSPKTYREGEKLNFEVNFNEEIVFGGSGNLLIDYSTPEGDMGQWEAQLSSKKDSSFIFKYTVQQGDEDLDGLAITIDSLYLSEGDTLFDLTGNFLLDTSLRNIGDLFEVLVDAQVHTPSITDTETDEDIPTSSGLVITRNAWDSEEASHFHVSNILHGRLFLSDGMTEVVEGSFITFQQGTDGLIFVPEENYNGVASFDIQSSLRNNETGLGGEKTTATIRVHPVNDKPVVFPVDDMVRTYGDGKEENFDITPYLYDVDNTLEELTWSVKSSMDSIVSASVDSVGLLTINMHPVGSTYLTVSATDLDGETDSTGFHVEVLPAELIIIPNNKRKEYGFSNPELDGIIEGFQYDDKGEGIYTTDVIQYTDIGFYDIEVVDYTMTQGEKRNYTYSTELGTFEVYSAHRIFIPNLFTPNRDGISDAFKVRSLEVDHIRLKIYDTMGTLLFETTGVEEAVSQGWDGTCQGKEMPSGDYIWQLEGAFLDGSKLLFEGRNTGVFTLVR